LTPGEENKTQKTKVDSGHPGGGTEDPLRRKEQQKAKQKKKELQRKPSSYKQTAQLVGKMDPKFLDPFGRDPFSAAHYSESSEDAPKDDSHGSSEFDREIEERGSSEDDELELKLADTERDGDGGDAEAAAAKKEAEAAKKEAETSAKTEAEQIRETEIRLAKQKAAREKRGFQRQRQRKFRKRQKMMQRKYVETNEAMKERSKEILRKFGRLTLKVFRIGYKTTKKVNRRLTAPFQEGGTLSPEKRRRMKRKIRKVLGLAPPSELELKIIEVKLKRDYHSLCQQVT
jgi:hypothetical protein